MLYLEEISFLIPYLMNNSKMAKELIYEFIKKSSNFDISKIQDSTLLFREGIFDSMAFILLIDFIEEKFGIRPTDDDLIEENFESVEAITRYIHSKKQIGVC